MLHNQEMTTADEVLSGKRFPVELTLVSIVVFCYLVARVCIQSVTIDEADSFIQYATGPTWAAWYPAAANHLLNTLLARLSWSIFGFNQVALRLPALLGAAIYLTSAVNISGRMAGGWFRLVVLLCLVLNPFVLDYLVAARGYSLAVGLLLAAVAIFWHLIDSSFESRQSPPALVALASVFLGLSFTANFSFAIANFVTGALCLLTLIILEYVSCRSQKSRFSIRRVALLGSFGTVPAIAVAFFFCSFTLLHWRDQQLVYGANSLAETGSSILAVSFPPPNPELVNETIYPVWALLRVPLCWLAIAILGVQTGGLFWLHGIIRRRRLLSSSAAMAVTLLSSLIITLGFHWAAFRAFHLLLPQARTGLFFVPLVTLSLAAGASAYGSDQRVRYLRIPAVVAMVLCAAYFLTCLRLHYFQEWRFNEDTKNVFFVLEAIEERCGIHKVVTEWHYVSTLNFYRIQFNNHTLKPFEPAFKDSFPEGRAYVFWYPDGEHLIEKNRLSVWYHNLETGAAVAASGCVLHDDG